MRERGGFNIRDIAHTTVGSPLSHYVIEQFDFAEQQQQQQNQQKLNSTFLR